MRFVCSLIPRLTRYDKHVISVNESQIICYLFSTIDLHSIFSTSCEELDSEAEGKDKLMALEDEKREELLDPAIFL